MSDQGHLFGGDWSQEKLKRLRKYLSAYATIMKDQNFRYAYIDAFAGTGYRERKRDRQFGEPGLFPQLAGEDSQRFIEGSARVALQVEPRFQKYIFIEQDPAAFESLLKVKSDFPQKKDDIECVNADANKWLIDRCTNYDWSANRAVVFLDPFGMQVAWETIEAIAETEAIDLWILFPLGVAVNRLLRNDREIQEGWRKSLDATFGTDEWFEVFYEKKRDLFGERFEKSVNLEDIGRYYNDRLKDIFAGVAENPLPLYNSRGNPLYLLCFAAANPTGAPTALRIAEYILSQ